MLKEIFNNLLILKNYLEALGCKLNQMGAQKIRFKGGYYWLLNPKIKAGEDIWL